MLAASLASRALSNPISGILSSVNGMENITDQFAKVCDFGFSLNFLYRDQLGFQITIIVWKYRSTKFHSQI